jgi:hypothetical protein
MKLFWQNLHNNQLISLSFDAGNAANGLNYAEKSFMKLTTGSSAT